MVCLCSPLAANFSASLQAVAALDIALPPFMVDLSAQIGIAGGVLFSASAMADLYLTFPGFTISAAMAAQISATIHAAMQISAALNIDPWSATASAELSAFISGFNLNLGRLLPYVPVNFSANLSAAIQLNAVLSLIAAFRASLKIDLLGPLAMIQLQALLSMGMPALAMSLSASLSASVSATISAQFNATAQLVGGFPNLIVALQLLLKLQLGLPVINGPNLMLLMQLSVMASLSANIQAVLGLSASATMSIQAALQPLWLLASLSAQLQLSLPALMASLSATATASATADVSATASAFASLTIPSLGLLAFSAKFAADAGLLNSSLCSFGCPLQALAS